MQIPTFSTKKKTVFIEVVVLILFFGGLYYLYTQFSEPTATVSSASAGEPLLGANSILFLKAINQDKINFRDVSFMDSELVKALQDFSEIIPKSTSHGREDPFTPYASSRLIR